MSFRSLHLAVELAPARFEFVLTRGTRQFHWLAAKVPTSVSPERRKSKKSKPEYLHVWQTLKRIRYSSIPFGVERPSMVRRSLANALIACSALLLFQGTPSWLKKVNRFSRSLSKRALHFSAAALKCPLLKFVYKSGRRQPDVSAEKGA